MLNNRFRFLGFKLYKEESPRLRLSFPISLYVLQELLESILDLLAFICLFLPKQPTGSSTSSVSIYSIKELVLMVMNLLDTLRGDEPYQLIDVNADKVKVSISVK